MDFSADSQIKDELFARMQKAYESSRENRANEPPAREGSSELEEPPEREEQPARKESPMREESPLREEITFEELMADEFGSSYGTHEKSGSDLSRSRGMNRQAGHKTPESGMGGPSK